MKKYELIESNISGLYRIRALRDFSDVKKGYIGGYVSGEHNLSHYGNCWIYDEGIVCDDAKVFDNAVIKRSAKVSGNAEIFGNAKILGAVRVYGNAKVHGNAKAYYVSEIRGTAEVCGNTVIEVEYIADNRYYCFGKSYKYHAQPIFDGYSPQEIQLGCYIRTIDEWRNDFWNNEKEFPKGSKEAEYRLKALNMCLIWLGEEPIKMEDIL